MAERRRSTSGSCGRPPDPAGCESTGPPPVDCPSWSRDPDGWSRSRIRRSRTSAAPTASRTSAAYRPRPDSTTGRTRDTARWSSMTRARRSADPRGVATNDWAAARSQRAPSIAEPRRTSRTPMVAPQRPPDPARHPNPPRSDRHRYLAIRVYSRQGDHVVVDRSHGGQASYPRAHLAFCA